MATIQNPVGTGMRAARWLDGLTRGFTMPLKSLDDLFHDTLRDVYYAEKKLTKVLPKMAKNASNEELVAAFEKHLGETENQVARLEQVFGLIGKPARAKKCEAMEGLAAEGDHVIEEAEDDAVLDAGPVSYTHLTLPTKRIV